MGLIALMEGALYACWPLIDGESFSPASMRSKRASITQEVAQALPAVRSGSKPEETPAFMEGEEVHPFLGYVRDSMVSSSGSAVGEFRDLVYEASPERMVIGIFGGSVAMHFANNAIDTLEQTLRTHPAFAGKEIRFISVTAGGYKQPQQLLALNYLLSIGAHFDVIVNIDGFNEVALAPIENVPQGVSPFFPRSWSIRTQSLPDASLIRLAGEEMFLQQRRSQWAQFFDASVLNISPSANFLWLAYDRMLQKDLYRTQMSMLTPAHADTLSGSVLPPPDARSQEELMRSLVLNWQRSSLQMKEICAANAIRYFHFLQPNQYLPLSKILTADEKRSAYSEESPYRPWVERGYPLLRQAGKELTAQGENFEDLTQLFARTRVSIYKDNCCHFNALGNDELGSAVGRFLLHSWETAAVKQK